MEISRGSSTKEIEFILAVNENRYIPKRKGLPSCDLSRQTCQHLIVKAINLSEIASNVLDTLGRQPRILY
jgi:hypothetical protein